MRRTEEKWKGGFMRSWCSAEMQTMDVSDMRSNIIVHYHIETMPYYPYIPIGSPLFLPNARVPARAACSGTRPRGWE